MTTAPIDAPAPTGSDLADTETPTLSVLHRLDLSATGVGNAISIAPDSDFESYRCKLMEAFYNPKRFKSYRFQSLTTEVAQALIGINAGNWSERTQIIAARLHNTEKNTQSAVSQLTELRSGSLVQILTQLNGQQAMILTKVDHSEYLDDSELKSRLGLPFRQRVQKSMIALYEDADTIAEIRVSDTNAKIATYWWQDFLELVELKTAERNTQLAFSAINRTLRAKLHKKNKKSDFWALRNAVISYFRTQPNFNYDTLIDTVFQSYPTDDDGVDMPALISALRDLPQTHQFDTQFTIAPAEIKAKMKDCIKLGQHLELNITGEIPNMAQLIQAEKAADGRKCLRIYSDQGYDEFAKLGGEPA